VHLLGKRPFTELPSYGRLFDVAIIPFRINELTRSVSPIKLKEYLAMGKPVVSTPLPAVVEAAEQTRLFEVAAEPESFLAAIERCLADDSPSLTLARQESVRGDTWEARAMEVGRVLRERLAGC
jgi:glycosyltransferase involved in cell wall biosynthesis